MRSPRRARPTGRRVATATAPPRSNAIACSAAAPTTVIGRVAREQLRAIATEPQRARRHEQLRGAGRDRRSAARRRRCAASSRAAPRSRRGGDCRGRRGSAPTARSPGRRRERRARSAAAAWPRARSTIRRPRSRRRTTRAAPHRGIVEGRVDDVACRRCSNAAIRLQPASSPRRPRGRPSRRTRAGARASPATRRRSPARAGRRRVRGRWWRHRVSSYSTSPHRSGISESTASRARTSSPRFVSWVDSVVIACGHAACRAACAAWNSSTDSANTDGSPPTSVSVPSRVVPVEGGVLDALRHHRARSSAGSGGRPRCRGSASSGTSTRRSRPRDRGGARGRSAAAASRCSRPAGRYERYTGKHASSSASASSVTVDRRARPGHGRVDAPPSAGSRRRSPASCRAMSSAHGSAAGRPERSRSRASSASSAASPAGIDEHAVDRRRARRSRSCRRSATELRQRSRRARGSSRPATYAPPVSVGEALQVLHRGRAARRGGRPAGRRRGRRRPSGTISAWLASNTAGYLDAHGRETRDGEEPAIVQVGGLAPPEHELVVLPRDARARTSLVLGRRAPGREREDGARSSGARPPSTRERTGRRRLARCRRRGRAAAPCPPPKSQSMSKAVGVAGRPAVGQHVPPPRVLVGARDADVVRDDVDQDAEARVVAAAARRARAPPLPPRAGSTAVGSTTS